MAVYGKESDKITGEIGKNTTVILLPQKR